MCMATAVRQVTVEEFRALPETPQHFELRHGEIVPLTFPKLTHIFVQHKLFHLMLPLAETGAFVGLEFPFRPQEEYQLWRADVAYLSSAQLSSCRSDEDFRGVPEIVVEVLSPSNSANDMFEREAICLENGGLEFWVIDPKRRSVRVSTRNGVTKVFREGQDVPFCGGMIPVASIF